MGEVVTLAVIGTPDAQIHEEEIPEDQLDGIFNAMKGEGTAGKTSGASANLGLGLYIADQIVHAHNGTLDVESSEERGTTFTVRLPRKA